MCRCGTHHHDDQSEHVGYFLATLVEAIRARNLNATSKPEQLDAVIYDCVTEAIPQAFTDAETIFESRSVQEAIDNLHSGPWARSVGISFEFGISIAESFKRVLDQRCNDLAGKWLDAALECRHTHPNLPPVQSLVVALLQSLWGRNYRTAVRESAQLDEQLTHILNHPRTERARLYVLRVGYDRRDAVQYALAREIYNALWGLSWSVYYRSVLKERGDLLASSHRHGYGSQNGSVSQTIVRAFGKDERPAAQVAEAWLTTLFASEEKSYDQSKPMAEAFITFQQAIDPDGKGFDYCVNSVIPKGLRQCVLTDRFEQIVDQLPLAGEKVKRPQSCVLHLETAKQAAESLANRMRGAIWGLKQPPSPYPEQ